MEVSEGVWVVWLLVVSSTFGLLEWLALRAGPNTDTLSGRIRAWLGVQPPRPHRRVAVVVFAAAVAAFAVWFVPHIVI